jgi:hypothetical protein
VILHMWSVFVLIAATHVAMLAALGIDFALRPEEVLAGLSVVPRRGRSLEKFVTYPITLLGLIHSFPITVLVMLGSYAVWWKVYGAPGLLCLVILHAFAATQYQPE